jgi:hypothetical protein
VTGFPIRALWAVPRSTSTAFERMVIERGDHHVVDEPFSRHYYFGRAKVSARYDHVLDASDPAAILRDLEAAARDRPVFLKDMAYHLAGVDPSVVGRFRNAFLIRDPAWALPSLARHWPDFTDDEAGYAALATLVEAVEDAGQPVVIIDRDDLLGDPAGMVAAWCEHTGLPPDPEALSWAAGMRPEWVLWRDWYGAAARSTGFGAPPEPGAPPPTASDERVVEAIARHRPLYEALHQRRCRPVPVDRARGTRRVTRGDFPGAR